MSTTPADIKKLGTILGVWAHPDDETYCAGGLIAQAAANGQTVICMTATKGELGIQDEKRWPADKLADIRTKELEAAYKILGVTKRECMYFPDGKCKQQRDDGWVKVHDAARVHQPDSIITFGPDGLTGHLDHQAVSAWATRVGKEQGIPVYHFVMPKVAYDLYQDACEEAAEDGRLVDDMFFNVDHPKTCGENADIYMKLSDELWQKKLSALEAMPSQTEKFIAQLGKDYYKYIFQYEAFKRAK